MRQTTWQGPDDLITCEGGERGSGGGQICFALEENVVNAVEIIFPW